VEICYSYYDIFGTAPENHFHDELINYISSMKQETQEQYITYTQRIKEIDEPNKDYVLSRLSTFVRQQEFDIALEQAAELSVAGSLDEAELVMQNALKQGIESVDIGIDYLGQSGVYRFLHGDGLEFLMKTDITELDKLIGGLYRGSFVIIMGPYKGMKSWFCQFLAVSALLRGLKVLHVSHENSLGLTEKRYDMMVGSLIDEKLNNDSLDIEFNQIDENGHLELCKETRGSVNDSSAVMNARSKLTVFGGKLIIKKYPMGLCNMRELERHINYLEAYEHFIPDVIINDYADIMAPLDYKQDTRNQINETYMYHKRIADERNILMITPSQVTNEANKRGRIHKTDAAEDKRKLGNVDLALAIGQTAQEKELNQGEISVIANRNGPEGIGCRIGSCLEMGQFHLWDAPIQKHKKYDSLEDD